jgi:phage-related minor tail protein
MADDSIIIQVKDNIDSSIAGKLRAIGSEAKAAQKSLDGMQKGLGDLGKATAQGAINNERLAAAVARTQSAQDRAAISALRLSQAQERASARAQASTQGTAKLTDALNQQSRSFTQNGISAKQYSAAMRGVPAQITDIVVSLQGGQKPLTVLLQQGGQLKDMFGGIRPALGALASGFVALINPVTIVIGVLGTLGAAFLKGRQELIDFKKEVTITGGVMDVTASKFYTMQTALDTVGTRGKAAEALTEVAKAGNLAGSQIENIAKTAILMEKATGRALDDTISDFKKLADEPVKASLELNKTYNYLTLSVYEQIKALEKQKDVLGAAELAEKTYADAMSQRAAEVITNAGYMEKAWSGVTGAAKSAWDAMLGIGREQTNVEKLAILEENLTRQMERNAKLGIKSGKATQDLEAEIDAVKEVLRLGERQKLVAKEYQATQKAGIAAAEQVAKMTSTSATKQEQLNKALSDYRANLELIRKANPNSPELNPDTIKRNEANLREQYKTNAQKGSEARAIETRAMALRKVNLELDNEIRLLGMLGPEREKAVISDRIEETLAGKKITLSAAENKSIQDKIALIVENAAVSAEYNRIYEESTAVLDSYNASLLATGDLLARGKISQEEANKQISLANEKYKQATQPLYSFNKQLEEAGHLRQFHGNALQDEITLLQLRNEAIARGQPLAEADLQKLRETIRLERERNTLYQAQSALIAQGPGARQTQGTQIQALGGLKASGAGGFSNGDAAAATTGILAGMGIDTSQMQVQTDAAVAQFELMYEKIAQLRANDLISAQEAESARAQIQNQQMAMQVQNAQNFFGVLSQLQNSHSKEAQRIGKAAAITQAIINTYEGATKALAQGGIYGGIMAAAVIATGLAQVQNIRSQGKGFMTGGYTGNMGVNEEAGVVHGQEFVMNAAATRRIGVGNLEALQAGAVSVGNNSKNATSSGGRLSVVVENYGTPQVYEQKPGISADEVRLIARDEARKEAPKIVAAEVKNPNSQVRKSMSAYTNVTRKESA